MRSALAPDLLHGISNLITGDRRLSRFIPQRDADNSAASSAHGFGLAALGAAGCSPVAGYAAEPVDALVVAKLGDRILVADLGVVGAVCEGADSRGCVVC